MGGALVFAILVALMVSMKLAPSHPKEVVTTGTDVLVASRDMMAGEVLKTEDVHWESYPDNAVFGGMIKKKEQSDPNKLDAYGKPLKRDVLSGEPITTQAIVDAHGSGNYLAAALGPGMRAVGVSVKPETTAGGFISPGDYVDVILTFQVSLKGDAANFSDGVVQRVASETILSNVHVLAVDQNSKDDAHEAKVGRTVTLEVTKQGAQILSMAANMGEIAFALRRLGDKDTGTDADEKLTTDVSTSKVIQKIYQDEAIGGTKSSDTNIRLFSGNDVSNVPVRPTPQAPATTGE